MVIRTLAVVRRVTTASLIGLGFALASPMAAAIDFDVPLPWGEDGIHGALNTTLTAGVGFRTQGQSVNLIGKADLNPNVCGTAPGSAGTIYYQDCQGVFRDQSYPAARLSQVPGQFSMHNDDGDLNYGKGSFFQAPLKVTPDLTLTYKNFGFFARVLYFYDFVNNDKTERHPNMITSENLNSVGRVGSPIPGLSTLGQILNGLGLPIPPISERLYGAGGYVRSKRTDGEELRQAGTNLQYLDSYFYGKLPIPFTDDKDLTFKIGRQSVSWGESTTLVFNSINTANPINANNFYRVGNQTEEDFTPVNMIDLSFSPIENVTLEGFYQLEWQPTEAQTPGTYFSTNDVGTADTGRFANLSFGGSADDPGLLGHPLDNPLSLITYTSAAVRRAHDLEPRTSGQFGVKFDYYADWLNQGTDLSLYYINYHSRLPYAGFFATQLSCMKNATSIVPYIRDCPQSPLVTGLTGSSNIDRAKGDAVPLDTGRFFLEYPEDIHLIGVSFNTTIGEYSLQGEVAYRPNLPMQVAITDLEFASAAPTLDNCSVKSQNCLGTGPLNIGNQANGGVAPYLGGSDFIPGPGVTAYPDTVNLIAGHVPGSARSFPNFIIPYRGGVVGQNPATDLSKPLNQKNPGYVQGYERFQMIQLDLGLTRVLGASDNPFGADQIIVLGEVGFDFIPDLPKLDVLQIEGPSTPLSATAGADGSGADGSRQACSNIPDCSIGPDGLRFNPHQQDRTGYVDSFSWGYRIIALASYENVLRNVGLHPTVVLKQDIQGTSPGPGFEFVAGRKEADVLLETRYKSSLSFNLGYTWYWGGGVENLLSDRDFAQAFVKYQF
ncbi:MAG: hypothetical protein JWR16_517 [Nevskia sp.]|nr:hypothetical protein [Nevskia sp.]